MDSAFWLRAWQNNDIRFHQTQPNNNLVAYYQTMNVPAGGRWFIPLCGKTLDIAWLVAQGFEVVGIELSQQAVEQLFEALGVTPVISQHGALALYQADTISIWQGDFFDLSAQQLGRVDAVFDRASLVALPEPMRVHYTQHLRQITDQAQQLLVCFEYDQTQMQGPPFSISGAEVARHYQAHFLLVQLDSHAARPAEPPSFEFLENVWHLTPR